MLPRNRYLLLSGVLLLVIAVVLGEVSHRHAKSLAVQIVNDDVAGKPTAAQQAELADYAKTHMQSSVALVLSGSFQRATDLAKAASKSNVAGDVYQQAQAACTQGKADSVKQAACVSDYMAKNAKPGANPQVVEMPSKVQFTKSYQSPWFTFDATGIVTLLGLALVAAGLIGSGTKRLLPRRR